MPFRQKAVFDVAPGFEPGMMEPKPIVLPLHHATIILPIPGHSCNHVGRWPVASPITNYAIAEFAHCHTGKSCKITGNDLFQNVFCFLFVCNLFHIALSFNPEPPGCVRESFTPLNYKMFNYYQNILQLFFGKMRFFLKSGPKPYLCRCLINKILDHAR